MLNQKFLVGIWYAYECHINKSVNVKKNVIVDNRNRLRMSVI